MSQQTVVCAVCVLIDTLHDDDWQLYYTIRRVAVFVEFEQQLASTAVGTKREGCT